MASNFKIVSRSPVLPSMVQPEEDTDLDEPLDVFMGVSGTSLEVFTSIITN